VVELARWVGLDPFKDILDDLRTAQQKEVKDKTQEIVTGQAVPTVSHGKRTTRSDRWTYVWVCAGAEPCCARSMDLCMDLAGCSFRVFMPCVQQVGLRKFRGQAKAAGGGAPGAPEGGGAEEGGGMGDAMGGVDPYDLVEPVDLIPELAKTEFAAKMAESKWSEKVG
jgi:hypothetical protein